MSMKTGAKNAKENPIHSRGNRIFSDFLKTCCIYIYIDCIYIYIMCVEREAKISRETERDNGSQGGPIRIYTNRQTGSLRSEHFRRTAENHVLRPANIRCQSSKSADCCNDRRVGCIFIYFV